jgi:hypothetical protein
MKMNDQIHIPATLPPAKTTLGLYGRLGKLQSWPGCYGEKEISHPCQNQTPIPSCPAHSIVNISTELNTANASVQNILTSHRLSKKIKINTYRTIILAVVLYRCKSQFLNQRKEHILKCVWEQGTEKKRQKREEVIGD